MRRWLPCLLAATVLLHNARAQQASPTIFAPGVISGPAHDSAPAFTRDGKIVYFGRSNAQDSTILVSSMDSNGQWQEPKIAPFSGRWNDMEPSMSPDGSFLVFVSNRPAAEGAEPVEAFYGGKKQPGGNLWRVERREESWGEPVHLPARVNRSGSVFAPCVVGDGSVYFMEATGEKHRFQFFRTQWKDGAYQEPQPVAFSDGTATDVDPAVAPDESFAVFGSGRPPAQGMDLFIVFKDERGAWQAPRHLGTTINSPGSDAEARLSPDLQTLYFSSERVVPVHHPRDPEAARADLQRIQAWDDGNYNIWQTPLAPILKARSESPLPPTASPSAVLPVHHAKGAFEVSAKPLPLADAGAGDLLARMSLDKQFSGDLVGTGTGEMLTAGTTIEGSAGYVAIEKVAGVLDGRRGSFVFQHSGSMNRGVPQMLITVVPDSGTEALAGIAGTFRIEISNGKHSYDFEYTLPR